MSPLKKLILFLLICMLLMASLWVGFVWWDRGAPPGFRPSLEDVTVKSINRYHRGVRIKGMARYDVRIEMEGKENSKYLFPLMDLKDFNKKKIRVMVLSSKRPSTLITLEEMTVEGIARPPGSTMSASVYQAWKHKGFEFMPKFVLIEAFEEEK